jgi:hypothetical protein
VKGARGDDKHDDKHPGDDGCGARRVGLRRDGRVERILHVSDAGHAAVAVGLVVVGRGAIRDEQGVDIEFYVVVRRDLNGSERGEDKWSAIPARNVGDN